MRPVCGVPNWIKSEYKMMHRITINLLTVESAKEVYFTLSDLFEIVPFKNENGKMFLLSFKEGYIGCMLSMNINLLTSSNSEISKAFQSMNISHFGYTITDIVNDHVTFGMTNIKRESPQASPYRESAENIRK
jgi:hypothetical protein